MDKRIRSASFAEFQASKNDTEHFLTMWDKPLAKVVKLLYLYIYVYYIYMYIIYIIDITLYNMQLNDIKKVVNRGVNACALGPIRSH